MPTAHVQHPHSYEDLDRWRARSRGVERPERGSELAGDEVVWPYLDPAEVARQSLVSATQHLNLARAALEAGEVFGAGALVTQDHRRYGNARALTPCRLLVMNREKFLFAVQESPMFAIELLASIDQRLRDLKDCTRS